MPILDANYVLRYLLRDVPDQSEEARKAIEAGAEVTAEVLAEVVYVLSGVYRVDRRTVARTMEDFLRETEAPHRRALEYAFRLYGESGLDLVDCVLAGYRHAEGQEVLTFDRKLRNALRSDPLAGA